VGIFLGILLLTLLLLAGDALGLPLAASRETASAFSLSSLRSFSACTTAACLASYWELKFQ
jgi:hypothetical protein